MNNRYFLLLTFVLALTSPSLTRAQAPGAGGPEPQDPDPTAVPLDGGASLLLAGGLAYGLRQLRQYRRTG